MDQVANAPTGTDIPAVVKTPGAQPDEPFQVNMMDFGNAKKHLQRLIGDWSTECELTERRRKERKVDVNIEAARQKNELDEDETIIPRRVIDTNISRELPAYVNYLKNSRRIALFEPLDNPEQDPDLIEQDFTKKSTYTAWEVPHFKCIDGSSAHGWDAIELVYDEDKPGHFSLEQIGHDKFFFPLTAVDLQASPRCIRKYEITLTQLLPWVDKFGFDKEQVNVLLSKRKDNVKEAETIVIYKCFYKMEGIVYIAWFTLTEGCSDWLKKPEQHYIGIDEQTQQPPDINAIQQALATGQPPPQPQMIWQPKPLTMYPVFILPYRLNEEAHIVDAKGRCFLDAYKQEAETALWSAFINGMNRASNIYGAVSSEDGTGTSLKEVEGMRMTPGKIYSKPVTFFHIDYPDPLVIKALQFADTQNSNETNQVNFTAMNREDSRKTATEIEAAGTQQTLLNSVQLTLFSTFIRQIYSLAWLVVQSQALQNKISFLQIKQEIPMQNPIDPSIPVTGTNGQPQVKTIYVNNMEVIGQRYTIRAAGDVDVIQKQETLNKMRQDWPVISTTALKDVFLMDYVRLAYPERAEVYVKILEQSQMLQQMVSLIQRQSMTIDGMLKDHPELLQELPPQQQGQMAQMQQEASQLTGQPMETSA